MTGETDKKDKNESRKIAIALISLVIVLAVIVFLMALNLSDFVQAQMSPGLGLRSSAIISFILTVVIMIVFAIASGDGLLGELQFILPAFFLFFVIFWLFTAWIF